MSGQGENQTLSDEELARTVVAGANLPSSSESVRAAFAQLHDRYGRLILAFISSRIRNVTLAQDLSQDVWYRAWKMLPASFKGGQFRSWIYEIARNRIIDESRKRQTQQLPEEYDPAQRHTDDGEDEQIRLTAFRDCFGGLDAERQKVVQLRLAGRSHDDIGAELGINSNTAMTRFHRAKKDLADCMQGKLQ
jgi:RNA polymerase sigma-70 factor (ECF subfamily)